MFEYNRCVYGNIDDCNPQRQRKILIAFHDMIADIMSNKNFKPSLKNCFLDAEN